MPQRVEEGAAFFGLDFLREAADARARNRVEIFSLGERRLHQLRHFVRHGVERPAEIDCVVRVVVDVPADVLDQIRHFFEHYKDLEPGKWVKVKGWKSPEEAEKLIMEGVHGYESMEVKPKTA